MTPDWPEIVLVAQTVFGEARGESYDGKVAVAWTIRNRAEKRSPAGSPMWWGGTYRDVCLKPQQYSCWNKGDPNLRALLDEFHPNRPQTRVGLECLHAVMAVLLGHEKDPTCGATHYHTIERPPGAEVWPPKWAKGLTPLSIGRHKFYGGVK
jgi:N-acetylmuramoyl-L-alanine amidase